MKMEQREGNVFLSPAYPIQTPRTPTQTPCVPLWTEDSDDNHESWKEVFIEMGEATREVQARQARSQPKADLRPALPQPIQACISGDEIIIGLNDDSRILVPVRDLPGGSYELMAVPQKVWDLWNAAKPLMKGLGFRATKQRNQWYLRFRPAAEDNA